MVQPVKNILFASDLSIDMKQVFEQAVSLAIHHNTNIIILNVMKETQYSEKYIRIAFGEKLYQDLKSEHKQGARDILIGKNKDALKIRQAISNFFEGEGQREDTAENNSLIKKIIVAEGPSIADEIISTAAKEDSNLIVMGSKQMKLMLEDTEDNVMKKVLKKSQVPVFIVPLKVML